MKRFFIFLSLAALCIISANARILQYRFDTESKVNDWVDSYNTSACDCIFDSEYGYLKVTTKSADSYINHNF